MNRNNPNRQFWPELFLTLAIISLVLAIGGGMLLIVFWVVIWR